MLFKQFNLRSASSLFLVTTFIGFSALWISPFIVSLSTVLCGILLLIQYNQTFNTPFRVVSISAFLLLLLTVLDLVAYGKSTVVEAKLLLILGIVLVMLSGFILYKKTSRYNLYFFILLSTIVFLVNTYSVTNYLINKEYLDAMLLQSKSIPIPNMHHIHFGIINAITIFGLVGVLVLKKLHQNVKRYVVLILVIILVSFHILSSRTGLVSFYAAGMLTLLVYSLQQKAFKTLTIGFLGMVFLLIGAFWGSTSFRNKIDNSIEDYNSWGQGADINHKSMAMRIEAYKVCAAIIIDSPLGVGAEDQERVMAEYYVKQNTVLYMENRVGPHNQFLEFGVKYGVIGILIVILFFIALLGLIRLTDFPFLAVVVTLLVAFQFESLLERQTSIFMISVFIPLFFNLFKKEVV